MTTKQELIQEIKRFLTDKREDLIYEQDSECLPLQAELEDESGILYGYSKNEYETILKRFNDCEELITDIEHLLDGKNNPKV